jgi:DNA-binding CsgD family transcriptional regulator
MKRGRLGEVPKLSKRQELVFFLLGKGKSTTEIADELGLSLKTVQGHCDRIKRKLGAKSFNQLARLATLAQVEDTAAGLALLKRPREILVRLYDERGKRVGEGNIQLEL